MILRKKKKILYTTNIKHLPSGTAARLPDGRTWIVRGSKRFLVPSVRILESWAVNVINVAGSVLENYEESGKVGFRDGTLIQDMSDGKIYLIENSRRRLLTNPDVLDVLDWQVVLVSKNEADLHEDGEELSGL
jgi:hypothetical protein